MFVVGSFTSKLPSKQCRLVIFTRKPISVMPKTNKMPHCARTMHLSPFPKRRRPNPNGRLTWHRRVKISPEENHFILLKSVYYTSLNLSNNATQSIPQAETNFGEGDMQPRVSICICPYLTNPLPTYPKTSLSRPTWLARYVTNTPHGANPPSPPFKLNFCVHSYSESRYRSPTCFSMTKVF